MRRFAPVLVVLLAAGGCTGAEDDSVDENAEVPMRVVKLRPAMVDTGAQLFTSNCIPCHGEQGAGRVGLGPKLNSESFLAAASDDFLIRTIEGGRAGTTMVPWGEQLSRDDVYALVAYIRSWRKVAPAKLDESPLTGDGDRGEQLFHDICAACHGRSGAGYQETANGTGIGRHAFLREVSNGYLRHIIRHGKTGSKMKGFKEGDSVSVAELDDQQIEDVIVYLRSHAW